ncbi:MAG: helix-turn-helix transcriptional regulator [Anaerolineae bacterium]|jgi:poly-beta-hydroxybutyrate-responsive repressor
MPRGRRWQNGEDVEACPRRIHRFLEPCILLLVHCKEMHGYELVDGLSPFGFEENPVDMSTIYRMLRDMEDRELVTSHWDTSNAGPARRMYRLTEKGDRYLAWWVEDLRETDRVLHHFLETYGLHMRDKH